MYTGIESRNIQENCTQKIHHIDIFSVFNCQINDFPCDSFMCCHLLQDFRHFHPNFLRIFHFFKVKFPIAPTCCTKLNGVLIEAIFLYLKQTFLDKIAFSSKLSSQFSVYLMFFTTDTITSTVKNIYLLIKVQNNTAFWLRLIWALKSSHRIREFGRNWILTEKYTSKVSYLSGCEFPW